MSATTALIVIDAQESFRKRPSWDREVAAVYLERQQALIDGAAQKGLPIVQILHVDPEGVFSLASGHVRTVHGLSINPSVIFHKQSHSALVGTGLLVWLIQNRVTRILISGIRTEQCCETTARHASDLGYDVDYVTEATLTFDMTDRHGRLFTVDEIKARTELVLHDRFARVATVEEALEAA